MGGNPVIEVGLGDVGEGGVEFDADDLAEGEFAGDEHGAAFAGAAAEVDEGVVLDGVGWWGFEPVDDEGAEDTGGDTVVGGDVGVVGVAGEEKVLRRSIETAGIYAVGVVEGLDPGGGGGGLGGGADGGPSSGSGPERGCLPGR